MKIAVVGFATEGRVSYKYYKNLGHEITVCDANPNIDVPDGAKSKLGDDWNKNLDEFDQIVRSAGINPEKILVGSPDVLPKITTAVNEFLANCPTKNVIGVTGTKGKGTTSTLIYKMLEKAGKTVYLGANIGNSPLEFINQLNEDSWVVLELSSFQLCDIKHSPHIMVCLMVVPEHLDWHKDLDDYIDAKTQAFMHQNPDDIAIYYAENELSEDIASASEGKLIPYYAEPGAIIKDNAVMIDGQKICDTSEIKLLGQHNWQNVCAAITAVWNAGLHDPVTLQSTVTSFEGLEYRLQFVRELDEVKYFNDSFGTTPETAIVAIQSFTEPKVLIAGGSDKGVSFDELAKTIAESKVHTLIAIGDTGPKIAELVKSQSTDINVTLGLTSMSEIVAKAKESAKSGDVVLLSCGSASFGLFNDYKDRGQQFTQAVQSLV